MLRRLAPLFAAGVVLAACGTGSDDAATTSPTTSESTTPTTGASAGSAAPADVPEGSAVVAEDAPAALQFAAPLIGGGDIELTTLAGRPVLLWFWAPW